MEDTQRDNGRIDSEKILKRSIAVYFHAVFGSILVTLIFLFFSLIFTVLIITILVSTGVISQGFVDLINPF